MVRWLVILLALVVAAFGAVDRFTARVSPAVVMPGGTVRVTCHVPRSADNRWLDIGIIEVQTSGRQLDGESAPVTTSVEFAHVPCGAGSAFCSVRDAYGHPRTELASLAVAGCN